MQNKQQISSIVSQIEKAALSAAQLISSKFELSRPLVNWKKADSSLVTEADIESQHLLVEKLGSILPLVGEEDQNSYPLIDQKTDYILIDPLDGTTSAKRFGAKTGGEVGYGPIIGLVLDSRLVASVYVNIPQKKAFSASLAGGCESFSISGVVSERCRLPAIEPVEMSQAALLFFAGKGGELDAVMKLRQQSSLENYYRFGGFGNDCMRLALNYEQVQIQYSVKAWDLPAALLQKSVGCQVLIDPFGESIEIADYRPRLENPLISGHPGLLSQIKSIIEP